MLIGWGMPWKHIALAPKLTLLLAAKWQFFKIGVIHPQDWHTLQWKGKHIYAYILGNQ